MHEIDKLSELKVFKGANIPIILHSPNAVDGINYSGSDIEGNLEFINKLFNLCDDLNAKGIIIHPGVGTKDNFINFLKRIPLKKQEKIIIENMPGKSLIKEPLGFMFEDIKDFLALGDFKFCLDFTHAIKAAARQDINYKEYIKKFLELKPFMFHLTDGNSNISDDEHFNLGGGNFDLRFIKEVMLSFNSENEFLLTLETPKKDGFLQDLKNSSFFNQL